MNPPVRYARMEDGVSIAYTSHGKGYPVLAVSPPGSTSADVWEDRRWVAPLAESFRLIKYDTRGAGLSTRDVRDWSLDILARDIGAVLAAAGAQEAAIMAFNDMTPVAVHFAAAHRRVVSHLMLVDPFSTSEEYTSSPFFKFDQQVKDQDWRLYLEAFVRVNMQLEGRPAKLAISFLSRNIEPFAWHEFARFASNFDVSALLPSLDIPALVVDTGRFMAGAPRSIATLLPNAQYLAARDPDAPDAEAVREFLKGAIPGAAPPSGTAIILFTDIADSTALTERLGDAAFREKARVLDEALRKAVRDHGGDVIDAKTLGDGILATFPAASQAISAALACGAAGATQDLGLHVGLHAGDVIRESDNVFGGAVNIAARISALAPAGEVLVSDIVRGLARTSAGVTFEDRGEHALKGITEPQRVFAVRPA